MLRAAIYRRVSTGRQASRGASLDEQLEACRAYAARQGWCVVTDYAEAGRSAYAEDLKRRPQFQAMRAAAERREVDVVLVYDLSRFARRQAVQFGVGADLERLGVRLVSVTQQFDTATVEGFVVYSVLAMQAELSSRLLSQRMTAVRAHEAAQGAMMLKPPRGYTRDSDGRIVPSSEAPFIVALFQRAYSGQSGDDLLRWCNDQGRPMARSTLHGMLTNEAYAGRQRHRGMVSPAVWAPIVDPELFDAVQEIRSRRRPSLDVRSVVRTRRAAALAGLVFCANCGAKLVYEYHQRDGREYYRCSGRRNGGICREQGARAGGLEAAMGLIVSQLVLSDEVRARALELATQAPPVPATPDLAFVRERLRRLARAYGDGAYSDQEYAQQRAALEAALDTAPQPAPRPVDPMVALDLLEQLPELWSAATANERRAIVGHVVSHIYVRRNTIIALRPTRRAEPALRALFGVTGGYWATDGRRLSLLDAM